DVADVLDRLAREEVRIEVEERWTARCAQGSVAGRGLAAEEKDRPVGRAAAAAHGAAAHGQRQRAERPRAEPPARPIHELLRKRTGLPRPAPVEAAAEPSRSPTSSQPELPMYATSSPGATSANVFPNAGRNVPSRPVISICAPDQTSSADSDVRRFPKRSTWVTRPSTRSPTWRTSGGSSSTSDDSGGPASAGDAPEARRPAVGAKTSRP